MSRYNDLVELAYGGGDDVKDQVAWEIGLMPKSLEEQRILAEMAAEERAEEYVPADTVKASSEELARLAEDAGF